MSRSHVGDMHTSLGLTGLTLSNGAGRFSGGREDERESIAANSLLHAKGHSTCTGQANFQFRKQSETETECSRKRFIRRLPRDGSGIE